MKLTWSLVKKSRFVLAAIFAGCFFHNFIFSLIYFSQAIGFIHYKSIVDNFKVVVVVPRETNDLGIKMLEEKIYTSRFVRGVDYISSEQAWRNLKSDSFIDKNFQKYSNNSLPNTFVIKMEYAKALEIGGFIESLKSMDGVKDVLFDKMTLRWIGVFQRYLNFSYAVFFVTAGVMALSALILSVFYLLQKDYRHYANLLAEEFAAGFFGAAAGFLICFSVLSSIAPGKNLFSLLDWAHLTFAFAGSLVTALAAALLLVLALREVKKIA